MKYRSVWISDIHLGTRGSQAEAVLQFLRVTDCETLYLVGDVVDLWHMRKGRYWPQSHNDVVQKLLRKGRKGSRIVYIPGNHDEFCANFLGAYGNVSFRAHHLHTTAAGKRLMVMHGHEFDAVTQHAKWLSHLGDMGYGALLRLNGPLNHFRTRFGLEYWSLSAYAKSRVKNVVSYISRFEEAVVHYAELHRVDGIVCGHIHTPAVKKIRHVDYFNCGDWVENRTALVEQMDGRMELLRWPASGAVLAAETDDADEIPSHEREWTGAPR